MASSPYQPLVNQQLASSAGVLYVAPTGTWVQILKLLAVNVDTGPHTITFEIVPNGDSAGTTYITSDGLTVPAGGSYLGYNEYGLVLAPGDTLYGFADTAAKVNCFVAGLLSGSS